MSISGLCLDFEEISVRSDSMDPKSNGTFLLETLNVGETGWDGDLRLR